MSTDEKENSLQIPQLNKQSDFAETNFNLGLTQEKQGQINEALGSFQKAHKSAPNNQTYLVKLSDLYYQNRQPAKAIKGYLKAIEMDPNNENIHNNIANSYKSLGQLEQAEMSYLKALKLDPNYEIAHINYSDVQTQLGDLTGAISSLRKAIELSPSHAVAHWNLSIALLKAGDYVQGWEFFEWRWKLGLSEQFLWRSFPQPLWDGSDLKQKVILVWAEQGIADELYFASLFPQLLAQGAQCIIECEHRLVGLLQRSFPTAVVFPRLKELPSATLTPDIHFHCPAGSLMKHLSTSLDDGAHRENFLVADPSQTQQLRSRYQTDGIEKVVGLGWATKKEESVYRDNVPIEVFDSILKTPGIRFVSLQYGDNSAEIEAAYERTGVRIFEDKEIDPLTNMDDFAAQEAAMDLIVSNANSTAVLAAGLGVPVWGLLAKSSEWRFGDERDHSLWFPSMPVFRQSTQGDWSSVQTDLDVAFTEWANNTQGGS